MSSFEEVLSKKMYLAGALGNERPVLGQLYRFFSVHSRGSAIPWGAGIAVMEERGSAAGGVHLKMTDAPTPRGHRGTAWSSTGKIGLECTRKEGETIALDFVR